MGAEVSSGGFLVGKTAGAEATLPRRGGAQGGRAVLRGQGHQTSLGRDWLDAGPRGPSCRGPFPLSLAGATCRWEIQI